MAVLALEHDFLEGSTFHAAYDAAFNAERGADRDDLFCAASRNVQFHAVAHVEDLVHLLPAGPGILFRAGTLRENPCLSSALGNRHSGGPGGRDR